mgnify:CR=1 FL=1
MGLAFSWTLDQEEEGDATTDSTSENRGSRRPEVVALSWNNEELSSDALTINGFEHYKVCRIDCPLQGTRTSSVSELLFSSFSIWLQANDYRLAASQPSRGFDDSCAAWAEGDEPLYYIVSPKDIVLARPRDAMDHINW